MGNDRIERVTLQTIVAYTPLRSVISRRAVEYCNSLSGEKVTEEEVDACVDRLISNNILQIVDRTALHTICNKLTQAECHGPIFGMPSMGSVDFTDLGAKYLCELEWYSAKTQWKVTSLRLLQYCFCRFQFAMQAMHSLPATLQTAIAGPWAIGKWDLSPSQEFTEGFAVDIVQRNPNLVSPLLLLDSNSEVPLEDARFRDTMHSFCDSSEIGGTTLSRHKILALAMLSGLFGRGPLSKRGLLIALSQLGIDESVAASSCESLEAMQFIRLALRHDLEAGRNLQSWTRPPTPGSTLILTSAGQESLMHILNTDANWQARVLGVRVLQETFFDYFLSHDAAIAASERIAEENRDLSCQSVTLENIGRWCVHWWDIKEHGVRVRSTVIGPSPQRLDSTGE